MSVSVCDKDWIARRGIKDLWEQELKNIDRFEKLEGEIRTLEKRFQDEHIQNRRTQNCLNSNSTKYAERHIGRLNVEIGFLRNELERQRSQTIIALGCIVVGGLLIALSLGWK
jgi:hypothetical protein